MQAGRDTSATRDRESTSAMPRMRITGVLVKKKIKGRETVVGRNTPAVSELKSPPKGTGHPSRAGGNGREVKRVPATTRDAGDTGGP